MSLHNGEKYILENGIFQDTLGQLSAYCLHADDISLLADHNEHIETQVDKFNQVPSSISFISEKEWENSFHFVNVKLTKTADGELTHCMYRKPKWTGRYTHFASFVPFKRKQNLVRSSTFRVRKF